MDTKDIFFIHTKGDAYQRELADYLQSRLSGTIVSIWSYDDWNWMGRDYSHRRTVYKRHGGQIDPRRFLMRDPNPFIRKVPIRSEDRQAIRAIFRDCLVLVMFEPQTGSQSAGVALEQTILQEVIETPENFSSGPPVILRFFVRGRDSKTFAHFPISYEQSVNGSGEQKESDFWECTVAVCRAWLAHMCRREMSEVGNSLLQAAGGQDPSLQKMFVRWAGEPFPEPDKVETPLLKSSPNTKEPPRSDYWSESADEERIIRGLELLSSRIALDRARFAIEALETISKRCPLLPEMSEATVRDSRDFVAAITALRRRYDELCEHG